MVITSLIEFFLTPTAYSPPNSLASFPYTFGKRFGFGMYLCITAVQGCKFNPQWGAVATIHYYITPAGVDCMYI